MLTAHLILIHLHMRRNLKGKYTHHTITGGIGHNLPQEAPKAFADAIIEVDDYSK
jgi:pimeloyl-ACP methyl ester carboxylesterase